jgi:hypothetical protein
LNERFPNAKVVVLKMTKNPKVWKMLKYTQAETIKTNRPNTDAEKKGNALDFEESSKNDGMEKLDPELFHIFKKDIHGSNTTKMNPNIGYIGLVFPSTLTTSGV